MSILDVTAIAQGPLLAKAQAQSAPVAVPDNSGCHRFEPTASDADWNAGLVAQMSVEYFVGGQSVWKSPLCNVQPHDPSTTGHVESPHLSINWPFDTRIGQYVFVLWGDPAIDTKPDPRTIPVVGASSVVNCKASIAASVGVRQYCAPTAAQLPAPLPAPIMLAQPVAMPPLQDTGPPMSIPDGGTA